MTLAEINSRISFLTGVSPSVYSYKDRTLNLNKWYYQIQNWILQAVDGWDFDDLNTTTLPVGTTNLVAGQNDYSTPAGSLKWRRVRINYGNGLVEAFPTSISANNTIYTTSSPGYSLVGGTMVVYPTPEDDVDAGIEITADRSITPFSYTSEANNDLLTGTKVPGIDYNYHDLLAVGAAHEWKLIRQKDNSLATEIAMNKQDLQNHYGSKQRDEAMAFGALNINYE